MKILKLVLRYLPNIIREWAAARREKRAQEAKLRAEKK